MYFYLLRGLQYPQCNLNSIKIGLHMLINRASDCVAVLQGFTGRLQARSAPPHAGNCSLLLSSQDGNDIAIKEGAFP